MWPEPSNVEELLARKPGGHYRIETRNGRILLTAYRPGEFPESVECVSPGHANRIRMALSDEGLCGYVSGGA